MEQIVILGLGNILYGDEGFGVLLAQRLYAHWDFPENVEVVDGGTQGQTLLTFVERADKLLVLDAVDFGLEPGELVLRDNVPAYLTAQKIGPHQNSFSEVMGLAALRGTTSTGSPVTGSRRRLPLSSMAGRITAFPSTLSSTCRTSHRALGRRVASR